MPIMLLLISLLRVQKHLRWRTQNYDGADEGESDWNGHREGLKFPVSHEKFFRCLLLPSSEGMIETDW